jgi:hypothetical protein
VRLDDPSHVGDPSAEDKPSQVAGSTSTPQPATTPTNAADDNSDDRIDESNNDTAQNGVATESVAAESVATESVAAESVAAESVAAESVATESVAAESAQGSPSISTHAVWLAISIVVILASVVLEVEQAQVRIPGLSSSLPGLCTFKRATGLDCPGCGLTRCFISLGHGKIGNAFDFNPVGILFYAFVIIQVPFRIIQIVRIKNNWTELRWHELGTWAVMAIAILLLGQWVVRSLGSFLWGW